MLGIGAASGCRGPADGGAPPLPAPGESPSSEAPSEEAALRKYERFGYYPARARYDESFQIKDIATTGMAGRLTVLAYGFGSIDPSTLTCSMNNDADAYADYRKPFDASSSVGGVADPAVEDVPDRGGPLRGNFNQLKQLKVQFPHLKVVISLGGHTTSRLFSDIAASAASRKKFVSSCIDLYIRGNLPASHGSGGPGSASGIFDGFDIVWRWPASTADKANHALLLQELRRQLDEIDGSSRYLLTALLPANPATIAAGIDIDSVFQAVDFGNVQGYDFHGPWEPRRTYHHAQLATSPSDPTPTSARSSGDGAIKAYLAAGVAPDRLTLGLPLYGYGWTGVCKGLEDGLFQEASGVASGPTKPGTAPVKELLRQFAPEQLGRGGQVTDPRNYLVYDPVAIAAYGYNGSIFWSFDDADIIEIKASYIQTRGLRGAMLWSLDGDDGSLVHVLDKTLNANLSD